MAAKAKHAERMKKASQTCAMKLVPRLARHIFGDDRQYNKMKVRAALKKGGYKGPGWKDENRAIKVLTEYGFDMAQFERSGKTKVAAKTALPQLVAASIPLENQSATADAGEKIKTVTVLLMQGKKAIVRGDLDEMAGIILLALSRIRA